MIKTKFTKGPWICGLDFNYPHVQRGMSGGFKVIAANAEQAMADAILIAAAPEMYDMLASIENDDNKIPAWLWDKIQATLAKARGES